METNALSLFRVFDLITSLLLSSPEISTSLLPYFIVSFPLLKITIRGLCYIPEDKELINSFN